MDDTGAEIGGDIDSRGGDRGNQAANALVPEVPTDSTLPALFPQRLDWSALSASVEGVTGKDLADAGTLGEQEAQRLAQEDTLIKNYKPVFEEWFQNKFGWFIEIAEKIDGVRLNELRIIKDQRAIRSRILGERQTIIDARVAQEQRRLEAERLARETAEREAELAALRAQQAAAPAEQKAELAQVIEERKVAPLTPSAVGRQEVLSIVPGAGKPKGLTGTPVCWRHVENLREHFAFLASDRGVSLIGGVAKVTHVDRGSDTITISFTALKRDLETVYPGLSNHRGTETQNRGR